MRCDAAVYRQTVVQSSGGCFKLLVLLRRDGMNGMVRRRLVSGVQRAGSVSGCYFWFFVVDIT